MKFDEVFEIEPFSLDAANKEQVLTDRLLTITEHSKKNCNEYKDMLSSISFDEKKVSSYKELPFLPVRLFKELELKSIADSEVVKTLTSSGTTGQKVSKIFLDKQTASNQQKAMVKIVSDFTGAARMPMIIIDCPSVLKDRKQFSARGAGILGFSIFGTKKIYALDDDMKLDDTAIREFLEKHKGEKILLFGFTFMIWQYFYKELIRIKDETGETFDLSNAVMIHGGGWKKLVSEAVSPEEFHSSLKEACGLDRIHDYYGMVEQTGSLYMQCECGHLHASVFSDVIVRNPYDFSECKVGEKGIIQVVSAIPESYPGHSLLTEDEGVILGIDDCSCGRKGKYFKVLGRIKSAEIRGCSDTYAAGVGVVDSGKSKVNYLVGDASVLENAASIPPKQPFDTDICEFLEDLSKELSADKNTKLYPDVVTLGFWLRKASLNSLKKTYGESKDGQIKLGRGMLFHIAPSNVPVNYMYSLVSGLLMGNANIVRIPTRDFPQVSVINSAIKKCLERHEAIKPYITLVRYEQSKEINDMFSAICDVRIIWGGDETVRKVRESALSPRATEVTFADRYSLAVIDSEAYLVADDKKRIAGGFYNDTFLTDQNACTSPRVVVWTGSKKQQSKEVFWQEIHEIVEKRYELQQVSAVDKLTQMYLAAAKYGNIQRVEGKDNLIVRAAVNTLTPELMDFRGNCGYFYEYDCEDVLELRDFCNNTRCQTIGYFGDKEILNPLILSGIKGVDRVTKIGDTMAFDLIWDGYDLTERLTRTISIK